MISEPGEPPIAFSILQPIVKVKMLSKNVPDTKANPSYSTKVYTYDNHVFFIVLHLYQYDKY